ncbi:hypothetical protein [Nodosilinea sp. E11]|uniref:hypothetical protein n=1 Tax=Nodosilinea sp. E11 TaxID=3037479 RepID=UPI0029345C1C|nr:hypothetical protein [Nodosilinea sp. E11]WOD40281.1 hypothetical protein RRF56_05685 [Nodosilinea sp. E11]
MNPLLALASTRMQVVSVRLPTLLVHNRPIAAALPKPIWAIASPLRPNPDPLRILAGKSALASSFTDLVNPARPNLRNHYSRTLGRVGFIALSNRHRP